MNTTRRQPALEADTPIKAPTIGYYIGSFDPPTLAHRAAVVEAINHFGLKKVYITVNHCTDKDFNASIAERVTMLRLLFAEFGDAVVILREPLEGRRAFARWVLARHPGEHVIGIFGDDTFEKNFKIFAGEPRFDFVKIARPMTEACAAEAAYVPVVYDIMLQDADGVSSSEARRRIGEGLDLSDILTPGIVHFVSDNRLYPKVPLSILPGAERQYLRRWGSFFGKLDRAVDDPRRSELIAPAFKPSQSPEGQNDKFVRHVVESLGMPLAEQFRRRPLMERILQIRYPTHPMTWRSGVYIGSFDPASSIQADVVEAALTQGDIEHLTVGVLSSSARQLKLLLPERLRQAKRLFRRFGDRVTVVTAPALEQSHDFIRAIRNEQLEPLLAVFGANVFAANYERLHSLDNIRYAVAPMAGVPMPELPAGSLVLDLTKYPTRNR